jgi:hypothetical protein
LPEPLQKSLNLYETCKTYKDSGLIVFNQKSRHFKTSFVRGATFDYSIEPSEPLEADESRKFSLNIKRQSPLLKVVGKEQEAVENNSIELRMSIVEAISASDGAAEFIPKLLLRDELGASPRFEDFCTAFEIVPNQKEKDFVVVRGNYRNRGKIEIKIGSNHLFHEIALILKNTHEQTREMMTILERSRDTATNREIVNSAIRQLNRNLSRPERLDLYRFSFEHCQAE